MRYSYLFTFLFAMILWLFQSCEEPIESQMIGYDNLLVVEGVISDQPERQTVQLRRTSLLNTSTNQAESEAYVRVVSSDGTVHEFAEEEPGIYKSNYGFKADFSQTYQLLITTISGQEYASTEVALTPAAPIDSLWAEFQEDQSRGGQRGQGAFNFYLNIKNGSEQAQYYRWSWKETYKIRMNFPSRWKWMGGNNFVFRDETVPELQEEFCFRTESNQAILLGNTENQTRQLLRHPIHTIDTDEKKILLRYSFEITQYGLSPTAREYWEDVDRLSSNQGSLFDEQPGTLVGNMYAVANPSETVLGIFEVSQKSTRKIYYIPSDFYPQGLLILEYGWVNCTDSDLIDGQLGAEGAFMEEFGSTYELQDYYSCCGPKFVPKECGLCTLYGTNVVPEDWEE